MWTKKELCKTFSIRKQYREYNAKFFKGKLGDVVFDVFVRGEDKSPSYAFVNARKKRSGGYVANIQFNARCEWDERGVRETLLHEMVHYYHIVLFGGGLLSGHGIPFIVTQLRLLVCHGVYVPRRGGHKMRIRKGDD